MKHIKPGAIVLYLWPSGPIAAADPVPCPVVSVGFVDSLDVTDEHTPLYRLVVLQYTDEHTPADVRSVLALEGGGHGEFTVVPATHDQHSHAELELLADQVRHVDGQLDELRQAFDEHANNHPAEPIRADPAEELRTEAPPSKDHVTAATVDILRQRIIAALAAGLEASARIFQDRLDKLLRK